MRMHAKPIMALASGAILLTGLLCQTAQAQSTLAGLVASGGTLTVDDKTFSDFSFSENGLASFDPTQIDVTATESKGVEYLSYAGNISFASGGSASAYLTLNYVVTANAGAIDMIDLSYNGSAVNGSLSIDETAATGSFAVTGGTVVGNIQLSPNTFSGSTDIVPPETVLYVTKDISFTTNPGGGFDAASFISQSFEQVPEPTTISLLLLSFGAGTLRLFRKTRTI